MSKNETSIVNIDPDAVLAPEPTLDETTLLGEDTKIAPPPPTSALDFLTTAGREPIRIWKVKGPKGVGGEVAAILCQDNNEIVLAHTLPSGKFGLFSRVTV